MKPKIVISGVNLVDFGPLAVFRDSLQALQSEVSDRYEIIALVQKRDLLRVDGVTYMEFAKIKSAWWRRLWFEYFQCKKLSAQLKPFLWIAMHDMTPRVTCTRQVVYCHNPAPFYSFSLRESLMDPKFGMFLLFYRFLYGIGIENNEAVIVQQQWLRDEFEHRYGCNNVIVANAGVQPALTVPAATDTTSKQTYQFFYPAFPRTFKNHALLLQAVSLLEQRGVKGFELVLTVNEESSRYGKHLFNQYGALSTVRWLGGISRERVYEIYADTDCLLFPSKLETWGLPITEFKTTGKPILAADLPYSHETVGTYDQVTFFPADDAQQLSLLMEAAVRGDIQWGGQVATPIKEPFAKDWAALWNLLLPAQVPHSSEAWRESAK